MQMRDGDTGNCARYSIDVTGAADVVPGGLEKTKSWLENCLLTKAGERER